MGRRKKKAKNDDDTPVSKAPVGEARTSLRALLEGVVREELPADAPPAPPPAQKKKSERPAPSPKVAIAAPSETLRGEDRVAYYNAYAGVRPLARKEKARVERKEPPVPASHDAEARARLGALVAGGVRFEIERDDDLVRGVRAGTPPDVLRALSRRDAMAEATLDLHGLLADDAEDAVVRFVRREHRRGTRRVCIVHGKGLHSPGGIGVLRDRVMRVLTESGAAPVVVAFVTAPPDYGGSGALLVQLTRV